MCGIAGYVTFTGRKWDQRMAAEVVRKGLDAMQHRGPDGFGLWVGNHIVLGHVRLGIIDPEGGAQPMFSEGRARVLVYNGETYNFSDLRRELSNVSFRTSTDTEVLLHMFEKYGPQFADYLEGMFAYALWDNETRKLYLGIDPFGIKPLYTYQSTTHFLFASELGAIITMLRHLGEVLTLDLSAIRSYLGLGWFPAPSTPVDGVCKFTPGKRLSVGLEGKIYLEDSITLPLAEQDVKWRQADALVRLEELLVQSVERQLIADVPIGVLLSGGIDSTIVTALAARVVPGISTFTVAFSEGGEEIARVNEAVYARMVSRHLSTDHHEINVNESDALECLDDALLAMDEPIADPAVIPLFLVSHFAASRIRVALCGDGGDELFGGYLRYILAPYWKMYGFAPSWFRQSVLAFAERLPSYGTRGLRGKLRRLRSAAMLLQNHFYQSGPFAQLLVSSDLPFPIRLMSEQDMIKAELLGQLPGQLLPKTDRVTMRASIEARIPFLSRDLVGFASSLERKLKVRGVTGKYLLRQLAKKYVPSELVNRPKHGFRVPVDSWFRGRLAGKLKDRLMSADSVLDHVIPMKLRSQLISRHLDGTCPASNQLWALFAFSSWRWRHFGDV